MPIFIPKDISFTPQSLKKFEPIEDDCQDFIQDPEQFKDTLPQPYRMLDKIVTNIFENAWDIITHREAERAVEASKIKPPLYSTDVQIEIHGPCKSICSSPSGDLVFLGKTDGLAVLNANTQETIDEWKDPKMDIVNVETSLVEEGNCLVCTIDDLGVGRLFLYSERTLYLMYAFNEPSDNEDPSVVADSASKAQTSQFQMSRSAQKPIVTKCQASSNGDYVGVCFESVQTQENWLDVFKISKDVLQKELETANNRFAKKDQTPAAAAPDPEPDQEQAEASPPEGAAVTEGDGGDDVAAPEAERPDGQEAEPGQVPSVDGPKKSSLSNKSVPDKKNARFSAPTPVLKVKPPAPLIPCNFNSAFAAQSSVDATSDVLGSGARHQLSSHHMGMKQAVFEYDHEQWLKYEVKNDRPPAKQPTFHFIDAGRLLPTGLDAPAFEGQPTYLLVWWEDTYQVLFYPLTKAAKDVEHKAELLWPTSDSIVYSTLSSDNSLLALGLKNNNLIIWDMLLGVPRKTLHLSDTGSFFKLQFLHPSIYDGTCKSSPLCNVKPYTLATNCYLLVAFSDGQNFIVSCGLNDDTPPKQTSPRLKEWEIYTIMEPLPTLPELAVTMRKNGQAFVEDMLTGEILLAIEMPPPFKMFMPWQPVFALGGGVGGTVLYIRGHSGPLSQVEMQMPTDTENEPEKLNSLFVFKLRSYRTLDKYRKKVRPAGRTYAVHSLLKNRVDCLLKDRISRQGARQARMQQRWGQLKDDIAYIKELRERGVKPIADRAFTPDPKPVGIDNRKDTGS